MLNRVISSRFTRSCVPLAMSVGTKLLSNPVLRCMSTSQAAKFKPWQEKKILVAGCRGQIGTALTQALIDELGESQVIAADLVESSEGVNCKYYQMDVTDKEKYEKIVKDNDVDYILHLAAILSSLGEKHPQLAYDVNVTGATNAMNIARDYDCQLFVPSSIAAFGGENFPKKNTPNDTILQPKTIYGVSKVFNELLGQYYHDKWGVDFRSLRYPGVISSAKYAFNGTTDYSTEIFFHCLENGEYKCWLDRDQALPMIYVDDCIQATMQYLRADKQNLTRTVYNLAGISFTPEEMATEVMKLIPGSEVDYKPCPVRSSIAASWPQSLDDKDAQKDWGWKYDISMYQLAFKILDNIDPHYKKDRLLHMPEQELTAMGNINDSTTTQILNNNNDEVKIHFPLAEAAQASNH